MSKKELEEQLRQFGEATCKNLPGEQYNRCTYFNGIISNECLSKYTNYDDQKMCVNTFMNMKTPLEPISFPSASYDKFQYSTINPELYGSKAKNYFFGLKEETIDFSTVYSVVLPDGTMKTYQ